MASTFTLPSASQIRDNILRVQRSGLIARGVPDPNVTPGSDEYIRAQAIGDQIEIAMANTQVKADAMMPDTSEDDDLRRILAIYGMDFRGAAGATGNITLSSTANCAVTTGTQLIDGAGLRFSVTVGGTYANGETIPVAGVDTGKATNHLAGDTLRWVSTPAFSASTALVATGGLTGGVDVEDNETARARLYNRFRNPPGAGNWSQLVELAQASSTLVQYATIYPCVNGPANYGMAVFGYATSTSKSRVVPLVTVTNTVKPYVDGLTAQYVDSIITSVVDVPFDLSIELSLPASPKASPAGPGGGWTDGTSWPRNSAASATFKCTVTSAASDLQFTVDAPTAPTSGVTQIAWMSPVNWTLYQATVTSYSGTAGAYVVTLDKPFSGIKQNITDGNTPHISPNATNIAAYFDAVLTHFAEMGPGEKISSSAAAFYRAFRHPTSPQSWPYKVDATMLRALTDAGDEVADASFLYRNGVDGAAPTVPATVSDAPGIYTPNNLSFYEKLT